MSHWNVDAMGFLLELKFERHLTRLFEHCGKKIRSYILLASMTQPTFGLWTGNALQIESAHSEGSSQS